jgi:hypothetical protein
VRQLDAARREALSRQQYTRQPHEGVRLPCADGGVTSGPVRT